jgi:catechol 2,3-dioxygenase-like lactoylglutathione lyase family enzyme
VARIGLAIRQRGVRAARLAVLKQRVARIGSGDIREHSGIRQLLPRVAGAIVRDVSVEEWDWSLRVFDHVQVHASDYRESVRFYETVLAAIGIPRLAESDDWTDFTNLNVVNRRPPTQNLHLCFYAREKEHVNAFHLAGVEAGFRSNGEPGYRDYGAGYYAAYLLDPDGNNVEALYRDVGNVGHHDSPKLRLHSRTLAQPRVRLGR